MLIEVEVLIVLDESQEENIIIGRSVLDQKEETTSLNQTLRTKKKLVTIRQILQ